MKTSSPRASYLADPTVQSLTATLREISLGLLAFPRFQRPFVWLPKQRLELIRTILRGLPIGTFMTWRTQKDIPSFDSIGAWRLPSPKDANAARQYVLDGLQRLSTLYAALTPDKPPTNTGPGSPDEEAGPREVYVDLSSDDLDVLEIGDDLDHDTKSRLKRSISLTDVLDSRRLLKRQRSFGDLPEQDLLIERADRVAEILRNYKVPIVPFVSDDLEEVTRAFQLVNSHGTQMSQVHMINALSWQKDFHFLDTLEALRSDTLMELGWDGLDETVLLRCFALAVGLESYGFNVEDLVKGLKSGHALATEKVKSSLRRIADVLRKTCHVRNHALVPYSTQTVVLFGALCDIPSPTKEQRAIVRDWMWFTSYVEAFSGATNASLVSRAIAGLRDALLGEKFEWNHRRAQRRPFPSSVDFRHARARVFALRLAKNRADCEKNNTAYRLLAAEGGAALPNVLPPSGEKGSWRFGRGARVLVARDEVAQLRGRLRGPYDDSHGRRHLITRDAWSAYRDERYRDFVAIRERELEKVEDIHFKDVRRRLLGK